MASLTSVEPVDLKTVQQELGPNVVLIEYFIAEDDLLVAVISMDTLKVVSIAGWGGPQLHSEVEKFRRKLEDLDELYAADASALFSRLLEPCLSGQTGDSIKQLCIVPAGALHYVPFDAFLMPAGEFVTERFIVSYAASASALVYAMHRRGQAPPSQLESQDRTLVVAEPMPRIDYGSLPGAVLEGERIRDVASEPKDFLQGRAATERNVVASLTQAKYFHFAGHTDLPPSGPMQAALLCTEDVDFDGRLEVQEIFELDLRACELAVLSACETRLGRSSRGDEIVGLERAFLRAGIPTVVASLWKVEDASTSLLMETFYANLWQKKLPRAEALRQARLSLIRDPKQIADRARSLTVELARRGRGPKSPTPRPFVAGITTKPNAKAHPGLWAGFVISGDWR